MGEKGEDRRHVLANVRVNIGEIGQIESAVNLGVPLDEQEIRHPLSLAGVFVGDVEELFEGEEDPVFHVRSLVLEGFGTSVGCQSSRTNGL